VEQHGVLIRTQCAARIVVEIAAERPVKLVAAQREKTVSGEREEGTSEKRRDLGVVTGLLKGTEKKIMTAMRSVETGAAEKQSCMSDGDSVTEMITVQRETATSGHIAAAVVQTMIGTDRA
jgi:hypothetical protein